MLRRSAIALVVVGTLACPRPQTLDQAHEEPDLITATHVVLPGQNLFRISRAYGVSVDELMALNGIEDPKSLVVGQRLLIPGVAEAKQILVTADGGTPELEERSYASSDQPVSGTDVDGRAHAPPTSGGTSERGRRVVPLTTRPGQGKGDLEWPVRGVLYARFGKKGSDPHDGIDLAAP